MASCRQLRHFIQEFDIGYSTYACMFYWFAEYKLGKYNCHSRISILDGFFLVFC